MLISSNHINSLQHFRSFLLCVFVNCCAFYVAFGVTTSPCLNGLILHVATELHRVSLWIISLCSIDLMLLVSPIYMLLCHLLLKSLIILNESTIETEYKRQTDREWSFMQILETNVKAEDINRTGKAFLTVEKNIWNEEYAVGCGSLGSLANLHEFP